MGPGSTPSLFNWAHRRATCRQPHKEKGSSECLALLFVWPFLSLGATQAVQVQSWCYSLPTSGCRTSCGLWQPPATSAHPTTPPSPTAPTHLLLLLAQADQQVFHGVPLQALPLLLPGCSCCTVGLSACTTPSLKVWAVHATVCRNARWAGQKLAARCPGRAGGPATRHTRCYPLPHSQPAPSARTAQRLQQRTCCCCRSLLGRRAALPLSLQLRLHIPRVRLQGGIGC